MSGVTWSVEDFRKGQIVTGQATTLTPAKAAAERAVKELNRPMLAAVKATVSRRLADGGIEMFNLKVVGRGRLEWAPVEVAK